MTHQQAALDDQMCQTLPGRVHYQLDYAAGVLIAALHVSANLDVK